MEYLVILLPFIIFGGAAVLLVKRFAEKIILPPVLPQEGVLIPLMNAWQGTRFLNIHNGLWASLRLFEDHFEFTVFTKKSVSFGDVAGVDYVKNFLGVGGYLLFKFNNGSWDFAAYANKNNLKEVIKFFAQKGVNVTEKAIAFSREVK